MRSSKNILSMRSLLPYSSVCTLLTPMAKVRWMRTNGRLRVRPAG